MIKEKNRVGRPRGKHSTTSLGHLGLSPKEDDQLKKLLIKKDRSLSKVLRYLIREWLKQQSDPDSGTLKLNGL